MSSLPPDFYSRRLKSLPRDYRCFAAFASRFVPPVAPIRVLDVGVGRGDLLQALRNANSRLHTVALDLDVDLVRAARSISWAVQADFDADLPFRNASVDVVVLSFVIHLTRRRSELFAACHRVLRPGGIVLILTASEGQLARRFMSRFFPSLYAQDYLRYGGIARVKLELRRPYFSIAAVETVRLGEITVDSAFVDGLYDAPWSSLALLGDDERREGVERLRDHVDAAARRGRVIRTPWTRSALVAIKSA